jgi:hypothetical protein
MTKREMKTHGSKRRNKEIKKKAKLRKESGEINATYNVNILEEVALT